MTVKITSGGGGWNTKVEAMDPNGGSPVEIKNVSKIRIRDIEPDGMVVADLTIHGVALEMDATIGDVAQSNYHDTPAIKEPPHRGPRKWYENMFKWFP